MQMKLIAAVATLISTVSAGPYLTVEPVQSESGYGEQTLAHVGQSAALSRQLAERAARVIRFESERNQHGYKYAFETENGIRAHETGEVQDGTRAQGGFSYTGDDGVVYDLAYTADENGFRPHGAHLPTPPPIPDAILKSLQQNAEASVQNKGYYVRQGQHQGSHGGQGYDGDNPGFQSVINLVEVDPPEFQTAAEDEGYEH